MRKFEIAQGALFGSFVLALSQDFALDRFRALIHLLICACLLLALLAYTYYRYTPSDFRYGTWWARWPMMNVGLFLTWNLILWGAVLTTPKG